MTDKPVLTHANGAPVIDNLNILTVARMLGLDLPIAAE